MPRKTSLTIGILAGICLAILLALPPGPAAGASGAAASTSQEPLPVKILRLTLDPSSGQPVVLLSDLQEERALPVWIGPCEANAMKMEMEGTKAPRPQTHDLLQSAITKMKGKIQKVIVTHSKDGVYYAALILEREGAAVEIDARPSDSLVLALKFKAPILAGRKMFQEMSVPLKEERGAETQYGFTAQDLTPSLAQSFGYQSTRGVLVSDVQPGSPAEKDGLRRGDIVAELGGEAVSDTRGLKAGLSRAKGPVKAKVFRNGQYVTLTLHGR